MLSAADLKVRAAMGTDARGLVAALESDARLPISSLPAPAPAWADATAGAVTPTQARRSHAKAARMRDAPLTATATRTFREPPGRPELRSDLPWRTAWRCVLRMITSGT
jgi:hypothetical protein